MKRLLTLLVLLCVFMLSSCSGEPEEVEVEVKIYEITTILSAGGHVVEQKGYGSVFDYNRKQVELKYDLELDMYALYHGDVEETEDGVYMVVFYTTEEAIQYYNAFSDDSEEGRLIYQEGQCVVITESEDIIALFK